MPAHGLWGKSLCNTASVAAASSAVPSFAAAADATAGSTWAIDRDGATAPANAPTTLLVSSGAHAPRERRGNCGIKDVDNEKKEQLNEALRDAVVAGRLTADSAREIALDANADLVVTDDDKTPFNERPEDEQARGGCSCSRAGRG